MQIIHSENGFENVATAVAPFLMNNGPTEVISAARTVIRKKWSSPRVEEWPIVFSPMENKSDELMPSDEPDAMDEPNDYARSFSSNNQQENYTGGRSDDSEQAKSYGNVYYDCSSDDSQQSTAGNNVVTDESELENLYNNMKLTRTRDELIAKIHGIFNKRYGKNKLKNGDSTRVNADGKDGEGRKPKNHFEYRDDFIDNVFMQPSETRIS